MPEGPEIAREADRIRQAIGGREAKAVRFAFPTLQRRARSFAGERVDFVRARGKALLIGFANGLTIYSHNQLYGRWLVTRPGEMPETGRQLRLAIEGKDRWALLYSASEIEILDEVGLGLHPYLARLGPDALDPALDTATLVVRLADRRFLRRRLAALLLDQSFVAGLGNYLRSEICFEAQLDPALRPLDLDAASRDRLARALLRLPRRAYRLRGVTLPDFRARALRAGGESWGRARHWVFARAGAPCRLCGTRVERLELAGRRIYVCWACQPASP